MKYTPAFHPFGVALRSKPVPDRFVTKNFLTDVLQGGLYPLVSHIRVIPAKAQCCPE
jgi:hypothetical protein